MKNFAGHDSGSDDRSARWVADTRETASGILGGNVIHDQTPPRLFAAIGQLPADRQQLIFRVRRQIAENNYETPQKIEAALDRIMDSLR